jgi:hypothetical protein
VDASRRSIPFFPPSDWARVNSNVVLTFGSTKRGLVSMLPYLAFSRQAYLDPTIQATALPIGICQTRSATKVHHWPPNRQVPQAPTT